jgi:ATP-dependent Zn protease
VSEGLLYLVVNWLPFIVLIGLMMFFMSRMRGGTTAQKDQSEAQRQIARHLDRIATALETRPK